jgi:hypothetical protein
MTRVIGSSAPPAASGDSPAPRCSCSGSKKKAPPNAAYTTNVTRFAAANSPELNSANGSGGFAERDSTITKPIRASTPALSATIDDVGQPSAGPLVSA